jgi:hypothetical protein
MMVTAHQYDGVVLAHSLVVVDAVEIMTICARSNLCLYDVAFVLVLSSF